MEELAGARKLPPLDPGRRVEGGDRTILSVSFKPLLTAQGQHSPGVTCTGAGFCSQPCQLGGLEQVSSSLCLSLPISEPK